MDPKKIVEQGYDKISYAYRTDEGTGMESDYAGWLAELTPLLEPGTAVLDLGCGCGVPEAQILAEQFQVTGVDISPVQIERAQALVPNGCFLCADMTAIDFPDESFAAIVSFYAIIHVPLAEQPTLLANMVRWLQPDGYLLMSTGHSAWTGTERDWLGAEMYWSHADENTYQQWLTDLGFEIIWVRFIPEGDGGHSLFLARKDNV